MCRLVAYLGEPADPGVLVFGGAHSLYRQSWAPRELLSGSVNADGYGVVWYADAGPIRIAETRPIWYDPDLRSTLESVRSHAVVAALRNGTPGLPVERSALLPMTSAGWTFVLNGFVPDFRANHMRALRAALPDDLYGTLTGVSDSETLFLLAVAHLKAGATLREALERTAAAVVEHVGSAEAQLTMMMTDGSRLAAVRTSNVADTNSLYSAAGSKLTPGGVVLASEPLTDSHEWTPVPSHGWIEVDTTGSLRTGTIEAGGP